MASTSSTSVETVMANDIDRSQCSVEEDTREKDAIESFGRTKTSIEDHLRTIGRSQINRQDGNVSPRLRRSRRTNAAERNARRCVSSQLAVYTQSFEMRHVNDNISDATRVQFTGSRVRLPRYDLSKKKRSRERPTSTVKEITVRVLKVR